MRAAFPISLLLAFVLSLPAHPAAPEARYTIVDPGLPAGWKAVAFLDLNDAGDLVGAAVTPGGGPTRAYLWSKGEYMQLPALPTGEDCQARGINAGGQIIGGSEVRTETSRTTQACRWVDGRVSDFGPPESVGAAMAINDAGQVVGYSSPLGRRGGLSADPPDLRPQSTAFLWDNGKVRTLNPVPGGSGTTANGINSRGQICGASGLDNSLTHAVLWEGDRALDLGTIADLPNCSAVAINDAGQVVCTAWPKLVIEEEVIEKPGGGRNVKRRTRGGTPIVAFLWHEGKTTPLGVLAEGQSVTPHAINNKGQVVGSVAGEQGRSRAFLWENGRMLDLNTLIPADSGWHLDNAHAINDLGEIVVYAYRPGEGRGLLLRPR